MLSKKDITRDWLPRYTGTEIEEFGDYILLTNFDNYVTKISRRFENADPWRKRPDAELYQ
jgi:hypothetical protein